MSNHYGQPTTWSTAAAPHLCSGQCRNFAQRDLFTRQMEDAETGEFLASILHSRHTELSFDATFDDTSTDFPDLSDGVALEVTGFSTAPGLVLVSRAVETWRIGQAKTGSIAATHYPHLTQAAPAAAGTLTAITPDQAALTGLHPAAKILWGTLGLTHTAGIVHGLTLTQEVQLTPDEVSPAGTILGVHSHSFLKTIQIEVLALTTGAAPVNGAILTVTGAPAHGTGFRIENVEKKYALRQGVMYSMNAYWHTGVDS